MQQLIIDMIKKFYIVLVMLIISSVLLLISHQELNKVKEENTNLNNKYMEISEKYTECQQEKNIILDEVIMLEEENQILGSYAAYHQLGI
tara:strand:+ start:473 stop:742 length:270 start_codon:yes stop_codon:yes gene_type:complete